MLMVITVESFVDAGHVDHEILQSTQQPEVTSRMHRGLGAEKAKVLCSALPSSCTDPNLGVASGTLRRWDY